MMKVIDLNVAERENSMIQLVSVPDIIKYNVFVDNMYFKQVVEKSNARFQW